LRRNETMQVLGLTGGVGMGKSTADSILRRWGIPVVDTDVLARDLVAPGQPALQEIRAAFGPEVLDPSGELRRGALAERVFTDPEARQRLESILHPRIRRLWRAQVADWSVSGQHPVAVVVIPLLFETGAEREVDATICVACSPATQRQRLRERGWSDRQIDARIASQWPVSRKIELATYVVWTEGSLEVHEQQLARILRNY